MGCNLHKTPLRIGCCSSHVNHVNPLEMKERRSSPAGGEEGRGAGGAYYWVERNFDVGGSSLPFTSSRAPPSQG